MLRNVTNSETDTFDEVNRVLNRLIDAVNVLTPVERKAKKKERKAKKKGGK